MEIILKMRFDIEVPGCAAPISTKSKRNPSKYRRGSVFVSAAQKNKGDFDARRSLQNPAPPASEVGDFFAPVKIPDPLHALCASGKTRLESDL